MVVISTLFVSCTLLQNGYTDSNGHYVPKNPSFKLKDKKGFINTKIDTIGIYKMEKVYNNGNLIYPSLNSNDELNTIYNYIKFYGNGRCLFFSIPMKDSSSMPNLLKEQNLNPNNPHSNKNYYYSIDGKNIQIESFVYGDGRGHYVVLNYTLNDSGGVLTMQDQYTKMIYKKETIPVRWNKYKANW